MFGLKYPYDLNSINPLRKKQNTNENLSDKTLDLQKRRELISFFIRTVDYKSMNTKVLIDELNRFLDGNLK